MEHEEQLSQLEIRKIGTSSNTINANQAEIEDETNIQELYENWGKAPDENGDTVIFIIIGIAIAIGIGIGIAIKLKKN